MVTGSDEVEFLIALVWQNRYLTSLGIKKREEEEEEEEEGKVESVIFCLELARTSI